MCKQTNNQFLVKIEKYVDIILGLGFLAVLPMNLIENDTIQIIIAALMLIFLVPALIMKAWLNKDNSNFNYPIIPLLLLSVVLFIAVTYFTL